MTSNAWANGVDGTPLPDASGHSPCVEILGADAPLQERNHPTVGLGVSVAGKHGGQKIPVKRIGDQWFSSYTPLPRLLQGDLRWLPIALGPELGAFLGYEARGSRELTLPDARELQGAIRKLNLWLPPEHKVLLQFQPSSEAIESNEAYLRRFAHERALPIGTQSHALIHDHAFHTTSLLIPNELFLHVIEQTHAILDFVAQIRKESHQGLWDETWIEPILSEVLSFQTQTIDTGTALFTSDLGRQLGGRSLFKAYQRLTGQVIRGEPIERSAETYLMDVFHWAAYTRRQDESKQWSVFFQRLLEFSALRAKDDLLFRHRLNWSPEIFCAKIEEKRQALKHALKLAQHSPLELLPPELKAKREEKRQALREFKRFVLRERHPTESCVDWTTFLNRLDEAEDSYEAGLLQGWMHTISEAEEPGAFTHASEAYAGSWVSPAQYLKSRVDHLARTLELPLSAFLEVDRFLDRFEGWKRVRDQEPAAGLLSYPQFSEPPRVDSAQAYLWVQKRREMLLSGSK